MTRSSHRGALLGLNKDAQTTSTFLISRAEFVYDGWHPDLRSRRRHVGGQLSECQRPAKEQMTIEYTASPRLQDAGLWPTTVSTSLPGEDANWGKFTTNRAQFLGMTDS